MSIENIEKQFPKMNLTDRSEPEPLSLSDMPNEITEEIVGNLDIMDRLVVRKVSRYLRDVIDEKKPEVQKLFCCLTGTSSRLHYTNNIVNVVMYSQLNDTCRIKHGDREHVIGKGDHIKSSINDLAIVLKNPKLLLGELCISLDFDFDQYSINKYSMEIKSIFESLSHQIHIKDVTIFSSFLDAAMSILPFLKPGTLENITFGSHNNYHPAMKEIVKLEQWKQAKTFKAPSHNFSASIEDLFHFHYFNIKLQSISLQDVTKIRDVLLRSPNFNNTFILLAEGCNVHEMKQIFESGLHADIDDPSIFKVPDSDNVFEIAIYSHHITIDKIDSDYIVF